MMAMIVESSRTVCCTHCNYRFLAQPYGNDMIAYHTTAEEAGNPFLAAIFSSCLHSGKNFKLPKVELMEAIELGIEWTQEHIL